jgi:hypothetical protein
MGRGGLEPPTNRLGERLCSVVLRDVMGVLHRRLNVGMTHVRLNVNKREHLNRQGPERVAEVMEREPVPRRKRLAVDPG